MAAQNPAQAGRLLTHKLPMPAHRAQPLLVAAVVVADMPAANRMAAGKANRLPLNQAAEWAASGGAYLLRRLFFLRDSERNIRW
jgi:hypothetical protein